MYHNKEFLAELFNQTCTMKDCGKFFTRLEKVLEDLDYSFVMEQILLSFSRPGAVLQVRQEGDCNLTLESHLSSLFARSIHRDVLGHMFTQPYIYRFLRSQKG